MVEEVLGGLVTGHTAGSDVFVDLTFALLPAFGPEPALVCGYRQGRPQFDVDALMRSGHAAQRRSGNAAVLLLTAMILRARQPTVEARPHQRPQD